MNHIAISGDQSEQAILSNDDRLFADAPDSLVLGRDYPFSFWVDDTILPFGAGTSQSMQKGANGIKLWAYSDFAILVDDAPLPILLKGCLISAEFCDRFELE
jgi:hypothetical protein